MKRLDDSTLEAVAETICGSGEGSGGGYAAPGPYRTKWQICDFFRRAGIEPQGTSSTRKWFVLESLQAINGSNYLEQVILRLTSPKEYRGEEDLTRKVMEYLNQILQVEGLEIVLDGVEPHLRERAAAIVQPKPKKEPLTTPPDFKRLVQDDSLAEILSFRWDEAQRCESGEAYLSAIVMMGSILEGVLLHRVEQNLKDANQTKSCQKNQSRKPKLFREWGLSSLIDVAYELGWLQGDVKRFSHALRESRNIVHPYVQRRLNEIPDKDTCSICWQVVKAAVEDLLREPPSEAGAEGRADETAV
jgi:hypothetical protein